MNYLNYLLLSIVGSIYFAGTTQASEEDILLGQIRQPTEQMMGQGHSAIWTMPLVATQYQPVNPTPAMQNALQAQSEARFLDALIVLENENKNVQAGSDTAAELNLLHASMLLQGNQSRQAIPQLEPLLADKHYAADARALVAMAYLQQGKTQQAQELALHESELQIGFLPLMALTYAQQGNGHLAEARKQIHEFNLRTPTPITLAREAELALTLNQTVAAGMLINQAQQMQASHPYVIAVSGLFYLIDGNMPQAKVAFNTALKRDPKDAKALFGLGLVEIKQGNNLAGLSDLQAAHESDPDSALILTYLGRVQQQLGQTAAAQASWQSAEQADPKDPVPYLYQAQAALQANQPLQARDYLLEAQARKTNRAVYRGDQLLKEDNETLQANLAEVQRQLGLDSLAFQTLSDTSGEKSSANLRNQADVLQGQRFAESARRSLLLQSLFNERLGNVLSSLDIYGDGGGQTGANTPTHGAVGGLNPEQASYNNYDSLFNQRTVLVVDAISGSQNTDGEQLRWSTGDNIMGLNFAALHFKSDGAAPFQYLDNSSGQAVVQLRPSQATQVFLSYQSYNSFHGETLLPMAFFGNNTAVEDNSDIARLGLRHNLSDNSELRGLWSAQQNNQTRDNQDFSNPPNLFSFAGKSNAHSVELQYINNGTNYSAQFGLQDTSGRVIYTDNPFTYIASDDSKTGQHIYATWQQILNLNWQIETELGWGKIESNDNTGTGNNISLTHWLPKLGVIYSPDNRTHARIAAWEGMGFGEIGDSSLAPVSIAGILLTRPGDNQLNRMLVHGAAFSADKQLNSTWLLTADSQQRNTEMPTFDTGLQQQLLMNDQVNESQLALHWQPQFNPYSLNLSYSDERIQNDPRYFSNDSIGDQHLRSQRLDLRWLTTSSCTLNMSLSYNQVDGNMEQADPNTGSLVLGAYSESFNQLDGDLNWQFIKSGSLTAGVRNANNTGFQYTEIDPLNPRFSKSRLVYAKVKLAL